jgi:hypothetical protein
MDAIMSWRRTPKEVPCWVCAKLNQSLTCVKVSSMRCPRSETLPVVSCLRLADHSTSGENSTKCDGLQDSICSAPWEPIPVTFTFDFHLQTRNSAACGHVQPMLQASSAGGSPLTSPKALTLIRIASKQVRSMSSNLFWQFARFPGHQKAKERSEPQPVIVCLAGSFSHMHRRGARCPVNGTYLGTCLSVGGGDSCQHGHQIRYKNWFMLKFAFILDPKICCCPQGCFNIDCGFSLRMSHTVTLRTQLV